MRKNNISEHKLKKIITPRWAKNDQTMVENVIENIPMAMFIVDKERKVRKANNMASRFSNLPIRKMEGLRFGEAIQCLNSFKPGGCGVSSYCNKNCLINRMVVGTFKRHKGFDGVETNIAVGHRGKEEELTLIVHTSLVNVSDEKLALVCIDDVTEYKRIAKKIEHFASFPRLNPNPVIEVNSLGKVTFANESAKNVLSEIGLKNKVEKFLPKDMKGILKRLSKLKSGYFYTEIKIKDRFFNETIHLTPQYNVVRIYAVDITKRKIAEQLILHSSTHDILTGIYNRYFFENQLEKFRKRKNFNGCIVMIDVDNLKKTNDKLGHLAGDKLIQESARFIAAELRKNDIVARFGGDEFCIILPNTEFEEAYEIVRRIQTKIHYANKEKTGYLRLSLSMGIAYAQNGRYLDETIKIADENMYENKIAGKM